MNPAKVGLYDFDGAYTPGNASMFHRQTFSVGIFRWVPKASGKGVKRSAVIKRIRGLMSNPEDVYRRAQAECDRLNMEATAIISQDGL